MVIAHLYGLLITPPLSADLIGELPSIDADKTP
jgi:hypothetical protein